MAERALDGRGEVEPTERVAGERHHGGLDLPFAPSRLTAVSKTPRRTDVSPDPIGSAWDANHRWL
jgi:hypothetical protein